MDASMGGVYGALGQAAVAGITASYAAKDAKAAAQTARGIRAANNAGTAAWNAANAEVTKLQRWAQGVRNSRVYERVGKTQEALAVNFNRSRDARTNANFADNIRQAEEAGRMQAAAAASGVTGSVVDVIDRTRMVRNNIADTIRVRNENAIASDYEQTEFDTRWAILDQLDKGLILDNAQMLDYTQTPEPVTQSPFSAAVGTLFANGGKNYQALAGGVKSFFKEPPLPDPFGGTLGIGDR